MSDLRRYRRRLPHWRIEDAVYFVTWRIERNVPHLDGAERDQVLSSLLHFHEARYILHAAVVMNDHVHVVVQPIERFDLEEIVRSWKTNTSRQFGHRNGRVWQPEYYDRMIRDERELGSAMRYVAENPIRRWPDVEGYPWVWINGN